MTQLSPSRGQQIVRQTFISLALVIATVCVYLPVRHYGFVNLDDDEFVASNPNIAGGLTWQSVRWAFGAGLNHNDRNVDYWRPLSFLSHALDIQLFGLQPAGHHLMNVGIHAAAAVALFLVLQSMTNAPWRSAFVAALFALHPLRVESVAWVTERKDVLSGLFFMLTLGAYTRYVHRPFSVPRYLAVFFLFALALMSKSMVVTLPFVLLLLDYWPLGRTRWVPPAVAGDHVALSPARLFTEKLPLLVLAAASSVMTFGGKAGRGRLSFASLPLATRVANALLSYAGYIGKMCWPTGLAVWYPLHPGVSPAAVMVAGIVLIGGTIAVIREARRRPWLITGWFWYLGMLVPVIGVFQGAGEAMADRYPYIPMVGLFIMASWNAPSRATERRNLKVIACTAAIAVLVVCAALSRVQVGYWKNSETLFQHALDVTGDNCVAHNHLGIALEQTGKVREAIGHYEQALQINPDYAEAHYDLGSTLAQAGRTPEAIEHLERALQIRPDYAEAHYILGMTLGLAGRMPEAIEQLQYALRIKPDLPEAHCKLGIALAQVGKIEDAIGHYEQALRIKPDYAEAHYNLGIALGQMGRIEDAIRHYEQALRIKPDYAEAHCNLGSTLGQAGRMPEAIEHLEQALRFKPDFAEAHYNLGLALGQAGKAPEAIDHLELALRFKPDFTQAQDALARLQARQ